MGRTISPRLRGRIISLIGKTGRWQSRRGGHLVRIERCYTPEGPLVSWRICFNRRWYGGEESTVFAAVEECNRFLAARARRNLCALVLAPVRCDSKHLGGLS